MKTLADKIAERFIGAVIVAFLVGYGWLAILNEGVTLHGKHGQTAYLSGSSGFLYAASTFLTAAIFCLVASRGIGLKWPHSFAIAAFVLLHPLAYFVAKGFPQ